MTPEERDLIEGVFDRMRSVGTIEKDPQAEAHINASVRQIRDSAYMLVQTVVVQDQALQQSEQRMQELEAMVAQLQDELAQAQAQSKSAPAGGGFLGGLFGGSKPAPAAPASSPWGGAVPPVGRQSTGYSGPGQKGSPWGGQAPQPARYNQGGGYAQPAPMQQAPQSGGGGFMKSAMATAAGVAGGVLVAGAIGNMMRGGHGSEGGTHSASGNDMGMQPLPNYQDASSNDQGGTYSAEPQYQDASNNDQGAEWDDAAQDASQDSDEGWGGGDIET